MSDLPYLTTIIWHSDYPPLVANFHIAWLLPSPPWSSLRVICNAVSKAWSPKSKKEKSNLSVASDCLQPLWTVAYQAPPSMEFSRQEYWNGLPFPSPGILLTQGSKPGLPHCGQSLYHLSYQGSPIKSHALFWFPYFLPNVLFSVLGFYPGCHIMFSHHISLGSSRLWQLFLVFDDLHSFVEYWLGIL